MSDFILARTPNYVAELLHAAPTFARSSEYESLDQQDRVTPGLVFSAFAKFMEASLGNQPVLQECRNAIECFASMNDAEAHNLLVTEVFETFRRPQVTKNLLLPVSKALYDRWIGR
jgi:hypothetical protein